MQIDIWGTTLQIGPQSFFYFFVVILVQVIGLLVYLRDTRNLTNLAFGIISVSVSLWLAPHVLYQSLPDTAHAREIALQLARLEYLGVSTISLTFCFFILAFLRIIARRRILLWIAIINSLVFTSIVLMQPSLLIADMVRKDFPLYQSWYVRYTSLGFVFVAAFVGVALSTFYILMTHYLHSRDGLRKKQMRSFFWAYLVAYMGLPDFLSCFGLSLQPIGAVAILFYSLLMIRGFLRERTFDLTALAKGNIHRLLAAIIVYLPALLLFRSAGMDAALRSLDPLVSLGFLILALALLRPLYTVVRVRLRSGPFRHYLDVDDHFLLILDTLKVQDGLVELQNALSRGLQQALQLEDCRVLIATDLVVSDSSLQTVDLGGYSLHLRDWLLQHSGLAMETKDVEFLMRYQSVRDELAMLMEDLGTGCLVSLRSRDQLLGLLCLGSKTGGADFTAQELAFIDHLQREASVYLMGQVVTERRLEQLAGIYRLGQEFLDCQCMDDLVALAAERSRAFFTARSVQLLAYCTRKGNYHNIYQTGAATGWHGWMSEHPNEWTLVLSASQPQVLVLDGQGHSSENQSILVLLRLADRDESTTILAVDYGQRQPTAEELRYISLLASLFNQSMEIRGYADDLESRLADRTVQIHQKNQTLTDSLTYAQRIQTAVLPSNDELTALLGPDHLLIWKPRDIVGGDFYWSRLVAPGTGWLLVGDCTGHGVPGALMSMLAISLLNREQDHMVTAAPHEFLEHFNSLVVETLQRSRGDSGILDGMDMVALYIDLPRQIITWSGAHLGIYCNRADGSSFFQPGSNRSIGDQKRSARRAFLPHSLTLRQGDSIYLASDGYLDQNGGHRNFSYGRKRFQQLLERLHPIPMQSQASVLLSEMERYAHGTPQRDDILVLGFQPGGRSSA